MTHTNGSPSRELSQGSPATDTQVGVYFLPEWVTSIFYGGTWHVVKDGTFREGIATDHGEMSVYEDPFDGEITFVLETITGYRIKKPVDPPPPEPKASVTELFPDKK